MTVNLISSYRMPFSAGAQDSLICCDRYVKAKHAVPEGCKRSEGGGGSEQINYWMYQQGRGTAPASPPAWGFGTRKNKAARLTMGYVDYLSFKTAGRGRMGVWMGLITSSLSADNRHFVVLFVVACKAEWKRRGPGFISSICNEILLPCASCAASASPQRRIRP